MYSMQPTATQPLRGLKVLELSTMVTASLATMTLASQGADVVKIEPLGMGDIMRFIGTQKKGISALFANCNRGKRSIAVNLKSEEGVEVVRALARSADVLVHNYRPGVMDRLGLGSAALREANPKLIYVAITGFGSEGPLADAPAYDHVVQALAGVVDTQSTPDQPAFVRTLLCDKITAYTVGQGITSALLARVHTGEGQHMDVSMLDSALYFLWPDGMMNQTLLEDGNIVFPPLSEYYRPGATKDGFIAAVAATDEQWRAMTRVMDRPDLRDDPRFANVILRSQNIRQLLDEMNGALSHLTTEEALQQLKAADLPAQPCLRRDEVAAHPQVQANGTVKRQRHPILGEVHAVSPPVRFTGEPTDFDAPCPALGQHSREILSALGHPEDVVQAFFDRKVVG